MKIEISNIDRKDYKKAMRYAIDGMHLNWYLEEGFLLNLYAKYFWHMELNRAAKAYGAYVDSKFQGVLLAEIYNEPKLYHSPLRSLFVSIVDWIQKIIAGSSVNVYDQAKKV